MNDLIRFPDSHLRFRGTDLFTGRTADRDVIIAEGTDTAALDAILHDGETTPTGRVYPASYGNMLAWERQLAPERRLVALNQLGYAQGFGAGNRIVISWRDLPHLHDKTTFGGWDGIYLAMRQSRVPFWFIQQSIVRELIPEGVDPAAYPGIGHTGGYGPRELLRAGLFAFASQGGYTQQSLPIGADADHAILIGRDEAALADSLALNKLALNESRNYTKFTVDTSHLFGFPASLSAAEQQRVRDIFRGRRFHIPNILGSHPALDFEFAEAEAISLALKYWRAAAIHKELYDHLTSLRNGEPFDYELSLDETPAATPPRELLFYLVLLYEVLGLPPGGVASAGPNIGFTKRHDYEGDLQAELWPQVNACASILHHFGAMLSVHSADGVRASTGKGPGVDAVLASATGGRAELKVADVYQEALWQVLAQSPEQAEQELFSEAWRRTYDAASALATLYEQEFATWTHDEAQRFIASPAGQEQIAHRHGMAALHLAQGAIGYGLPVFRLAAELRRVTDPTAPDAAAELFRRFMFLTFRQMRRAILQTMTHEGWQRLAAALEDATLTRLRGMAWIGQAQQVAR